MIDILSTQYAGEIGGMPIGTVITVAHDMLGRSVCIERMLLILRDGSELLAARIDGLLILLHL